MSKPAAADAAENHSTDRHFLSCPRRAVFEARISANASANEMPKLIKIDPTAPATPWYSFGWLEVRNTFDTRNVRSMPRDAHIMAGKMNAQYGAVGISIANRSDARTHAMPDTMKST